MHARWQLAPLVALIACANRAAPAPTPPGQIAVSRVEARIAPDGAASTGEPNARSSEPVTLLYRGRMPDDFRQRGPLVTTTLFGVVTSRESAWLTHVISGGGVSAYELVHVPLGPGAAAAPPAAPIERWTATPKSAPFLTSGNFYPLTSTVEADLARYARIVEVVGPHVTHNDHSVAVSRDHVLYGDGDHLTLRDRDGRSPRYFSRGVQSAYRPVLSPDEADRRLLKVRRSDRAPWANAPGSSELLRALRGPAEGGARAHRRGGRVFGACVQLRRALRVRDERAAIEDRSQEEGRRVPLPRRRSSAACAAEALLRVLRRASRLRARARPPVEASSSRRQAARCGSSRVLPTRSSPPPRSGTVTASTRYAPPIRTSRRSFASTPAPSSKAVPPRRTSTSDAVGIHNVRILRTSVPADDNASR